VSEALYPAAVKRLWRVVGAHDLSAPVWILSAVILTVLVVLPLGWVFARSLQGTAGLTLDNYQAIVTDGRYFRAIVNTLYVAVGVAALTVAVGAAMGWLVARTDLPLRGWIRTLTLASFVTPPFLGAFAWEMLAGPNAGLLNNAYRFLTGSRGYLINIYSLGGLTFVIALYAFPYVFIIITNALQAVSAEMEEAASLLGASGVRTGLTITFPLVTPALVAGFILGFLETLSLFGSPAILAMPAGMHTITTQIWALFQYPPRVEAAAAFSFSLLVAAAALLLFQRWILGRKSFATIGGRGSAGRVIRLGWRKVPALAFCLSVIACSVFLPYYVLLKAAFSKVWSLPLAVNNLTLDNWVVVLLHSSATKIAILNTLKLGLLTATVGAVLASLIAYIVHRQVVRGGQLLAFLAWAPLVIPGIVLGIGLLFAYSHPPVRLYGTLWILFLAYLTKGIPIGFSQSSATFKTIHPELEEAGRVLGASRLRVLRDITAPLAKSGVLAAWALLFIGTIRELSASIMLFTPQTRVVSVVIFDLKEEGQFGAIAALAVLLMGATVVVLLVMQRLLGRDLLGSRV
jgi:iron(III) transport system permease protein